MTVTELARCHLTSGTSIDNPTLTSTLSRAKHLMQSFTGSRFYYLQCIENPSTIYILGEWTSVSQHYESYIPSEENQDVLRGLEGLLEVDWLMHLDVEHEDLSLPRTDVETQKALDGRLCWSIVRHFIKTGEKDAFRTTFSAQRHHLQDFVTEGAIGGGWRLDKEKALLNGKEVEKEEFVLIAPWTSPEQHSAFAETRGFEEYGRIREWIEGAEIVHVRLLDI